MNQDNEQLRTDALHALGNLPLAEADKVEAYINSLLDLDINERANIVLALTSFANTLDMGASNEATEFIGDECRQVAKKIYLESEKLEETLDKWERNEKSCLPVPPTERTTE